MITPANTIFVPVKTGATGGFEINVFNAASGTSMYSLSTDYIAPSSEWVVPYQPVLATNSVETRLYYPGAGGTVYYIDNVDSASHGTPVQQVFYTTLANYQANASAFNSTVFIDTPITADSNGNVFFGFRVQNTAPAPLSTTQSGYARIDPNGNATYVLAGMAAGDANIGFDTHSAAPALSNDQSTVYVVVKSAAANSSYGYLLGLDATTLATKYKIFLKDPRNNNLNPAVILDNSTASPMVGPDNDVYFGIYGNPANGSRGFLLHFSSDLTLEKAPGGFGWDYTPGVVPASMVPSYSGTSHYLLFAKYNNYANPGNDSADGVNRIALLDPNATEVDAHASSNGMLIMREVLTVIGPTADKENRSASLPNAVREWCINTPAVNPATNSVFVPSEDGHMYRWNLVSNSLDELVQLNAGIGDPYVPTIIGPDGQVYTTNGGMLSAIGSLNSVGIALASSTPDVRNAVAGQSLTFSVAVTNSGNSGVTPTGMATITDTVYYVPSPNVLNSTTITLASDFPLVNGNAIVSTSALTADKHFITVSYSGDANFSSGNASLIQFVHASGTTTALGSSPNPSNLGQTVTFTATEAAAPPGSGTPTGQVTFQDQNNNVLAQAPLNGSGVVSFSTSGLALGSDTVTAVYASDTTFAASGGSAVQSVQYGTSTTASSSANPSTFGQSVTFTSTTTSSGGVPLGTVTFKEGATVWASNVAVNGSGQASFSTTALSVGTHSITAVYSGDSSFAGSTSNTLSQFVLKPVTLSTTTLAFGTQGLNSTSAAKTVTLTNNQSTALTLSGNTITGTNASAFAISATTCSTSLAAHASCTISITFTPAATGAMTATLSIANSASNSPQSVSLTGIDAAQFTLSVTSINFGNQVFGTTSTAKSVTLTNNTSAAVSISSISIGGTNPSNFTQSATTCGASLNGHSSCSISFTFSPSAASAYTATLSITDGASNSPQTVSLSGKGVAP